MSDFCPMCSKEGILTTLIFQRFEGLIEDPEGGKRCPRCFYEPEKGEEQMSTVPEQTLAPLTPLTCASNNEIRELKERIEVLEKWVANKQDQGL